MSSLLEQLMFDEMSDDRQRYLMSMLRQQEATDRNWAYTYRAWQEKQKREEAKKKKKKKASK